MAIAIVFLVLLAVEDFGHLAGGVVLPLSILELITEVQDKEGVLEVNEYETSIHRLLAVVILIRHILDCRVSILVVDVDLFGDLVSTVPTRHILDAQISPQILSPLDPLNVNRLCLVPHARRTSTRFGLDFLDTRAIERSTRLCLGELLVRLAVLLGDLLHEAFDFVGRRLR